MNKKLILSLTILLQLIISCTSIASVPSEPQEPIEVTLKDLSIYEAQLTSYALYLETFLIRTKHKFKHPNFPPFTLLDPNILKSEHTIEAMQDNIKHLKRYINKTKPIVIDVYKKYSKLKK
ncbi:hypothetical protein bcCo53_001223 (plasmid) [Borrelia coriaceae]|uniref:Outer surface protein n=1 Tax=Borrelia coriaceae ATCC 43381 TaxID=1408429 RepID=W5SVV5_9SPIR|nr:BBA14 family lipoprotein [Borrelia coriaceae]AHH11065.1 Outer surface protein [Borrelia coriaceae ATCC 43381]UPA17054.1 hypothetical protein bcCo53_001223 [Borrelia coriaceae]